MPIVIPYFQADHRQIFIYQQEEASSHYAISVRKVLNEELYGRWIGRPGAIEWQASHQTSHCWISFCGGYLKNKVYGQPICNLEHMKEVIEKHCDDLREQPELLRGVTRSVADRTATNGGHFEDKQ